MNLKIWIMFFSIIEAMSVASENSGIYHDVIIHLDLHI